MTAVIIASTRRFIAEAVALVFTADRGVSNCVVVSDGVALRRTHADAAPRITLFDLDAPVGPIEALVSATGAETGSIRRCGFFDEFIARHAETAFAMGMTVLFPLTSDPHQILDAVLHRSVELSVTANEGLTLRQLERLASLSPREMEVLQLLASGRSTKVIAHLLGITPHTANSHKRRIFEKLDVQSQAQAVVMAATGGVVTVELS